MPYKSRIEELIRKVFTGEASVQEVRSFFQNIRSDDDLDEGILPDDLLEETGTGESIPDRQLDKIWSKIELETKPRYQRRIGFPVLVRVAAAIAILIVACFVAVQIYQSTTWTTYETLSGEIRNIELEDGTSVVLNGNSILKVHKNLSAHRARTVYLTGEANFNVARAQNKGASFVVHTRDLDVEVLGTRFNVNSRERETSVYLEEGSVKIRQDTELAQEIYMSPGEKIEYSVLDKKLELSRVQSAINEISWREGIFEFEELPLDNILRQITEPYNYTYQIESPELGDRRYTLRIPDNNLEFAISAVEKLTGTTIVDVDGKLVIKEREHNPIEPSE